MSCVSRGKISLLLFLVAAGVFGFYFQRDLNLSQRKIPKNLPDIVVEKLDFRREIADREWHIVAESAEHESGMIRANSMDLTVSEAKSGRVARMFARSGDFSRTGGDVRLASIDGLLYSSGRSIDVMASRARFDSSNDVWVFDNGLIIQDRDAHIEGESAKITREGVFRIERGAYARWKTD